MRLICHFTRRTSVVDRQRSFRLIRGFGLRKETAVTNKVTTIKLELGNVTASLPLESSISAQERV